MSFLRRLFRPKVERSDEQAKAPEATSGTAKAASPPAPPDAQPTPAPLVPAAAQSEPPREAVSPTMAGIPTGSSAAPEAQHAANRATAGQTRIFVSYSHRGNGPEWKALLLRHLGVFERHHLLDVWQDGKIRVSSYWDDDITHAMSSARLAVMLLTPEALESQYILEKEIPFLRERQQRDKLPVFPVICEPCDWKVHDWLRATQAPNTSNPISPLTEPQQDHIFRQLATDIATELSRVALAELPKTDQPPTPEHIYLEKFPLTRGPGLRTEKLIRREQELALLDLAFAQPHTAIVSLVAWGGVGKTMLAQHWLQRLQREAWCGAQRVYAWSFYSQGTKEDRQASEDTFLAHALEWFGVQCEPTLSPWDKGRLLADAVARERERTLLILDGIEPLQYPPGPMGGQLRAPGVQSLLKHLARKANSEFRSQKSEGNNCLCLVTTREPLTDLADFQRREGSPWGSVLRVDLGNLTDEAGAALLHHTGANRAGAAEIKPDDKELLAASREVDGHALTLNLLGRFLARAHGGDIRRRDLVKFEEADREEQGGTTFKMLTAFENWFSRGSEIYRQQLAVLHILGLFDRPADAGCINVLRSPPVVEGLTDPLFTTRLNAESGQVVVEPLLDEDWNAATSSLAEFGLLTIHTNDDGERLLDCHPLIREHFAHQLRKTAGGLWQIAHKKLFGFLSNCRELTTLTTIKGVLPANLRERMIQDLQPLYHAIFHGCEAGMHQLVFDEVYWSAIARGKDYYSTKRLGLWSSDLKALASFFEQPWHNPTSSLQRSDRALLLSIVAFDLQALGRFGEAPDPLRASIRICTEAGECGGAANFLGNLCLLELSLGQIGKCREDAEEALRYANLSGDYFRQVVAQAELANALHQAGNREASWQHFMAAEKLQAQKESGYPVLYAPRGFWFCDLYLADAEIIAWQRVLGIHGAQSELTLPPELVRILQDCDDVKQRATITIGWAMPHDYALDLALDSLTLARTTLYRAAISVGPTSDKARELIAARQQSDAATGYFRRAGFSNEIPTNLHSRALLSFLEHNASAAQADLDEAWDIAERGPMRLHMADIHLYRARLFFREKPYPWKSPQDDLAAAEKLINECGYHRRDEELADAKRAILGF
jgi:tetratricopeptide (TPR) repeat protein